MSEYQYYEFRAIDEPLDEKAMAELRALSTRAEITPTSFVNVYNWGDFSGNAHRVLEKYFDAFVYVTNWGTHELLFRMPRQLIDMDVVSQYGTGESVSFGGNEDHVVLGLCLYDEGGRWEEGEGRLSSLISLRADILAGDLRCLYLGWLMGAEYREVDDDAVEPPVPAGLGDLSASLEALVEFLQIDEDLVAVAAQCSGPKQDVLHPSEKELETWIRSLEQAEKDTYLLRVVREGGANLRMELLKRFRDARGRPEFEPGDARRRTVGEILRARDAHVADRRRRVAEEEAAVRKEYLDGLAGRAIEVRSQVQALIETKHPNKYDHAVELLVDLRDLAKDQGQDQVAEFAGFVRQVRQRHARKSTFLRRMDQAAL